MINRCTFTEHSHECHHHPPYNSQPPRPPKPDPSISAQWHYSNKIIGSLSGNLIKGMSAYEIAVSCGFNGTEEEWLESLHASGADIEFRVDEDRLQYKKIDEEEWITLYDFSTMNISYEGISNKPSIDGTVLTESTTLDDLMKNRTASEEDIKSIFNEVMYGGNNDNEQ